METSDILNCAVRVKEEPSDEPDLQNFLLSSFPRDNSTHTIQKREVNYGTELDDEVKIIVECEDVKPDFNLLAVNKIHDYSTNYLQNAKDGNSYKTRNSIKIKAAQEVKQEFVGDDAEESNRDFDCELVEPIKKRKKAKNFIKEHGIPTNTMHNNSTHASVICGKTFPTKQNLKVHIDSVHISTKHTSNTRGKTLTRKGNLKIHEDSVHKKITHTCHLCEKKFSSKTYLKVHIDSIHDGIKA
ncbi:GDNF-inducible zinc finger protein 1-like [Trichogramma pretiosum]|uniref:GDNF-inducible zinc finger protein 1-like n=1 Tax=Trichogramma pretiosum TaxID=7493 RepID=UPI0006C95402|nr:GDNF-inducible zinc finger protein 1-like [Trichogramma pretiosum]